MSNVDPLLIFHSFLGRLKSIRSIGKVPSVLKLLDNIIAEELFAKNKAAWHGTCSNRYTESKLTRGIEAAKHTSNESQRSSKRKSLETKTDKCVICDKADNLIPFTTLNAEFKLRQMAMDMNDQNLLTKVIGQDFVSDEVKYHFKCLTYYRIEYRNYKNAQLSEESTGVWDMGTLP